MTRLVTILAALCILLALLDNVAWLGVAMNLIIVNMEDN